MVSPFRSKAVAAMVLLPPADSWFVARATTATMAVIQVNLMASPSEGLSNFARSAHVASFGV